MLARREFLGFGVATAAMAVGPRAAQALGYPNRPVRWVVGFPAGGPSDAMARIIGARLSQRLGQPFVIENRPGAGGNIGTDLVVNSPADGYTLLLVMTPNAINDALYPKLSFNFIRDISPVAAIARVPNIMVVNPSIPTTTVAEFITYAKANPGKINMGSGGNGSTQHIAGELFSMMAGVKLFHVPYRG